MQTIRRRASYRFALLSALLIVLPSVGFVIGASQSISFAYHIAIVLGIASLAVAFSIEVLSRETETRAKLLLLERNSSAWRPDKAQWVEWRRGDLPLKPVFGVAAQSQE